MIGVWRLKMRIDKETGNITHVDYESYEAMKEEYENKIEQLEQAFEDLKDEKYQLTEKLNEANDNVKFFIKIAKAQQVFSEVLLNQLIELKKDSLGATNESKIEI